ncbi:MULTISPECIES: ArpU family phage packaging/lysis transcriptional regulator [Bacillus]|uniref:ArpU family phage packaging/lysis transcriptional regulator n=1 Tax=Bacillus TaxID=1386 RepID=UPI0002EE2177|nr:MULTISPECIES: ArpU family phage packaging/lysis transcriptional regulator [Bacillus]
MERALENSLDYIERRIIEMKYLDSNDYTDLTIMMDLCIKKGKYYSKKKTAIYNLATALGRI